MPHRERRKKDGERRDKKNQRMRAEVSNRLGWEAIVHASKRLSAPMRRPCPADGPGPGRVPARLIDTGSVVERAGGSSVKISMFSMARLTRRLR